MSAGSRAACTPRSCRGWRRWPRPATTYGGPAVSGSGCATSVARTRGVVRVPMEVSGPRAQRGVGVIVPYDPALDRELWRWTPEDVSLLITRTPFVPVPVTMEQANRVSEEAAVYNATRDLLTPQPEVVAYACTSGSFVRGAQGE